MKTLALSLALIYFPFLAVYPRVKPKVVESEYAAIGDIDTPATLTSNPAYGTNLFPK